MNNHDFTTSQIERELINAFRLMPAHAAAATLRIAQSYANESIEKGRSKIRLVASAGRRTE